MFLGFIPSGIKANLFSSVEKHFSQSWKKNKRKFYFMIVPRNVKPHLATCCFRPVGICYTVLYNVINPLPLGFGSSLHNAPREFCKHIATRIFHGIKKRTVFSLFRLRWRCYSFVTLVSFTDQSLLLGVQIMLLFWKFSLLFPCMT